MTKYIPKVYTFGMSNYAVINLKTDPKLKKQAAQVADSLGISISAILNNELRRLVAEKSVTFEETPEVPNEKTRKSMEQSQREIAEGDYYSFNSNEEALAFLKQQMSE